MATRKQKIEELMESFRSLRRSVVFRPSSKLAPRITPSQWGVLMLIGQRHECTVKEIAQALSISSSAATQLIDGLVAGRYVTRKEDEKDRRRVTLMLSPKTKSHMKKMREQSVRQFLKLFEALSDKEFDQYIALNKKIVGTIPRKQL